MVDFGRHISEELWIKIFNFKNFNTNILIFESKYSTFEIPINKQCQFQKKSVF